MANPVGYKAGLTELADRFFEEHMEETEQGKRASEPGQREPVGGVCLEDLAYTSDYPGDSQLVIEDDALLEWAHSSRISPRDAQIEALKSRINTMWSVVSAVAAACETMPTSGSPVLSVLAGVSLTTAK